MAESGIECRSYSSQAHSLPALLLSAWHLEVLRFVLDTSDDSGSPHKGSINDRKKKKWLLLLFQVCSTFCL